MCYPQIVEGLLSNTHFAVAPEIAYHQAMVSANVQLHRSEIDDGMSGTTAVTVLVRGRTVHVANVGDSRAVLAERHGERYAAVDLSYDQTPYRCALHAPCSNSSLPTPQTSVPTV